MVEYFNPEHNKGPVATAIKKQTSKLPSNFFPLASLASMATSLTNKVYVSVKDALYVAPLASHVLLFGVYNKIVKSQYHY